MIIPLPFALPFWGDLVVDFGLTKGRHTSTGGISYGQRLQRTGLTTALDKGLGQTFYDFLDYDINAWNDYDLLDDFGNFKMLN